ncbi:sensor histidine kinase [Actinocorallia aurantiaca]|uniref:histidine kinase n=1 Tax=Actinocorallia aurantiaca TaxID=46204 RepID=A0ABN3UNP9_9ACTN
MASLASVIEQVPRGVFAALLDAAVRAPVRPERRLYSTDKTWVKASVLALTLALAIGFTGGSIALYINLHGLGASQSWLLGLLQGLPLLVAPYLPLASWRIMVAGLLLAEISLGHHEEFMPWPVTSLLGLLPVLALVAAVSARLVAKGVSVLTITVLAIVPILFNGLEPWFGLILSALAGLALVFGDAVGGRRWAEMTLAEQAELRRQDLARQAVLEERSRIARELHDVVAHHMSVIALQAEAAPYKIPELPDAARATFTLLRDEARAALTETRRVVGLLRAHDETAERVPQPGMDRLPDLVASHDGLRISLTVIGAALALPEGLDLSAYRIIQEALSNASRYAPGAAVSVEVRYDPDRLRLSVRDDGPHGEPDTSNGGHGLVGMRERVTMLGGTLFAGEEGEGWAVLAELPYDDAHDPRGDS